MTIVGFLKTLVPIHIIFFYVFLTSGLIVNFLQFCTLPISLVNIKLYRKLNTYLAYMFWINMTAMASYWSGSVCDVYMDPEEFKKIDSEHSICIMNHKYDIDWLMGWTVIQRAGLLPGSKIIGKSSLRLIPLIGWCWLATESIFIQRQWESDKKKLTEGFDKILNNYPDGHYFNILLFCEGTRFTESKYEASMKVAREKGLPELKHHLLPRTKGFSMLSQGASGRVNAIYDLTIGIQDTDGIKPNLNAMRNGVPFKGEMFVRRIPMSDVPQDDAGCAEFIHKLYREKDEIFDTYHREGSFKSLNVPKVNVGYNYQDLYIMIGWIVFLVTPLVYYLIHFIQNAGLYSNLGLLGVMVLSTMAIDMFIGCSSSAKGSKYGKATVDSNNNEKKIN